MSLTFSPTISLVGWWGELLLIYHLATMKIAFLSALNPTDIHAWSGTRH